ncbi:MAG: glycosyltransferase family 4 protein, partial [Planctomycetes bacterium]|nr:glycosyltransferase family 4 protein [Planctomycetota bacterium]
NRHRPRKGGFSKEILFIGNDAEEKGFGRLVKAMKYLPDFELSLVGTCAKKIRTKEPNVRVAGKVPSLDPYLEKCLIYAHPADFDPCPSVIWEAMYAGLIPVISEGVGQSEVFKGSLAKLVVAKTDPKHIADKIREVSELGNKKQIISSCKKLANDYTKPKSIARFKRAFAKLSK